jgi:hypothetical protein
VATFTGIATGDYPFSASKTDYVTNTSSVHVYADTGGSASIPLTSSVGDVTIYVYPKSSSTGISGATVNITVGSATQTATTNSSGVATFTGIATGTYYFTASATGYVTSGGSDSVTVTSSGGTNSVNLSAASYTIYSSASTGGTISPSGSTTCTSEGSVTYTIAYTGDYYFTEFVVNGVSTAATTSQYDGYTKTIAKPTANTSVVALFNSCPTITFINSGHQSLYIIDKTTGSYVSHLLDAGETETHQLRPGHYILVKQGQGTYATFTVTTSDATVTLH